MTGNREPGFGIRMKKHEAAPEPAHSSNPRIPNPESRLPPPSPVLYCGLN